MGPLRYAHSVVAVPPKVAETRGVHADLEGYPIPAEDHTRHEHSCMAPSVTLSSHYTSRIPDSSVEFVVSLPLFLFPEIERSLHLIKVLWAGPRNSEASIPFDVLNPYR
jgi:hypothetical protein